MRDFPNVLYRYPSSLFSLVVNLDRTEKYLMEKSAKIEKRLKDVVLAMFSRMLFHHGSFFVASSPI